MKKRTCIIVDLRGDTKLKEDCLRIAKEKDSDLSKEVRKFLKKYRQTNKL